MLGSKLRGVDLQAEMPGRYRPSVSAFTDCLRSVKALTEGVLNIVKRTIDIGTTPKFDINGRSLGWCVSGLNTPYISGCVAKM
jgi:hypothetical protein